MQENTLGLNVSFPIYNANGTPFNDLVIHKATLESIVMSFGDKLTGDVYYKDNSLVVTMSEYVLVNGIKYMLVNPPTIVREGIVSDNSELNGMTKYSFVFYHPMCMVGNFPFTDVAVDSQESKYLSDSKSFSWCGNLVDFIAKINANLVNTEWACVLGFDINSQDPALANVIEKAKTICKEVFTFSNNFVTDACKKGYEEWEIPYVIMPVTSQDTELYAIGKKFKIVFTFPNQEILDENDVPFVFKFGQGVGLKNNSRTPKNNKIVTRIVGYGSEGNIPYGYPQIRWYGDQSWEETIPGSSNSYPLYMGIVGGEYVKLIKHPFTRKTLMPSRFVEDVFNRVSPYAPRDIETEPISPNINYNSQQVLHDYHDATLQGGYPNPIDPNNPSVEIHQFEDIKPELGEKRIIDAQPYDNVTTNPLEGSIALDTFLAQVNTDLTTQGTITNENERVAVQALYDLLNTDGGEHHAASNGGSYTYTSDVTETTDYYYVKYVSDNINYDVVCLKRNHVVTPTWNDDMNDEGEYKQSYFKMKLPILDFDLYACAAITEEMKINMRSGACIGCTFNVMVDWEDYKRNFYKSDGTFDPVIHTTDGDGHVRDGSKYPNTRQGQVTFILQKDLDTFGTIMPNVYQQPKGETSVGANDGDQFVILGISLPQSYVAQAQERLDDAMDEYMLENNVYYYEYPLKFDEYFLAKKTDILSQIHNYSIVRFEYPNGGVENALYVKQLTIKYGNKPLPEYDITLTDDIEIVLNQIGQVTDDVSRMRVQLNDIQKYYSENLINEINSKISKISDDVAQGRITFQQGLDAAARCIFSDEIRSNDFKTGLYGGKGWRIDNLGNAEFESARVRSFLEIVELLVNRIQAQEGETVFTDNDQIDKVEKVSHQYIISFKEKFGGYITCQKVGNILKGVINTLAAKEAGLSDEVNNNPDKQGSDYSGNKYYTSWMRVVADHSTDNTLGVNQVKVMLYGDSDTPSGKNFEPCELMSVVRWGCIDADLIWSVPTQEEIEDVKKRQNFFAISAQEGRITKYIGVNQPKLQDTNIGTTLGILPDFVRQWSIGSRLIDGKDYLYAQGIVVGDFIKVDINNQPIVNYVDCGEWVDGSLVTPTIGHGIYLVNGYNPNNMQWETHDVWHNGAKWRCLFNEPYNNNYYEPTEANSTYWLKLLESGENAVSYEVEWSDINGATDSIPCNKDGIGKVVEGIGTDPWINAKIYKREGSGNRTLVTCSKITLRAFTWNGTEVTGSGFPMQVLNNSSIYLENYECYATTRMKYLVSFYIDGTNLTIQSSICKVKDGQNGTNGTNGTSAPQFSEEFYAWSDDPSTSSVLDPPTISGSWSTSIPQQGSFAYLWKKIIRYTLVSGSNPPVYQGHTPEYYRLNGENGTSIKTKGTVLAVLDRYETSLPLDGEEGEYIVIDGSPNIYKYVDVDWEVVGVANNGDYCIMKGSDDLLYWESSMTEWDWTSGSTQDGDAYTNQQDGHLWQYSQEASDWLDLGQFKGEAGKTYYTHIAWAESVTFSATPLAPYQGCLNFANATSVSGGTTIPPVQGSTSKPYMGYRIDEVAGADSEVYLSYTWQYVKGETGERGKIGRFFYFGGDFNPNDSTTEFEVNDAQTPYFRHMESGEARYHVFNPSTNPSSKITMYAMWNTYTHKDQSLQPPAPSFNMYPWESMTNDFKYLITEAIFGNFAKFGSAIISGDWMLSACGVLYDTSDNPHAIDAEHSWGSYNINNAYAEFDADYPNSSKQNAVNFVPNYCVDLKTGTTYENNAHIKGEVNATSGSFSGEVNANSGNIGGFNIGTNSLYNNQAVSGQGISIVNATRKSAIGVMQGNRPNDILNGANISSEFSCNEYGLSPENPSVNVAIRATANGSGYSRNFALLGVGDVVTRGMCIGYRLNIVKLTSSNPNEYMNLSVGNIVLLSGGNDYSFFLPKLSHVRDILKIAITEPFAVKVTILAASDDMYIRGYQPNATYPGTDYPPHLRDNDWDDEDYLRVYKGNVYTFMLVWDGTTGIETHTHYNAWLVSHSDEDY